LPIPNFSLSSLLSLLHSPSLPLPNPLALFSHTTSSRERKTTQQNHDLKETTEIERDHNVYVCVDLSLAAEEEVSI
jgi:hypothetical protein